MLRSLLFIYSEEVGDLSGSLACFGLIPLTRFIAEQAKSGTLLISQAGWLGTIAFQAGQLSAAMCENEIGRPALRLMLHELAHGQFQFTEGEPGLEPNLGPDPWADLAAPKDAVLFTLPGPTRVPRVTDSGNSDDDGQAVLLSRRDLLVLLDIDGRRTVRELAARHGLSRLLRTLVRLQLARLVELGSPRPAPPVYSDEPLAATTHQALGDGPEAYSPERRCVSESSPVVVTSPG